MKVKTILIEDFTDYKRPSMFIAFPCCTFKCDKECGEHVCQNSELVKSKDIEVNVDKIIKSYNDNDLTSAIVCGGLEPFDSWNDLKDLISRFRAEIPEDDIVIYTGYYADELSEQIEFLRQYKNIIIKFGRFIPDQPHHRDRLLGVELASPNQYAEKIS